jgi:hypothetical protein
MDAFAELAQRIIKEQQRIIGPLALREASKVPGLHITSLEDIQFDGNKRDILQNLVEQYARYFGNASTQMCKEVAQPMISQLPVQDVPDILKN